MQLVIQNGDERNIVYKNIILISLGPFFINGNVYKKVKQFFVILVILII